MKINFCPDNRRKILGLILISGLFPGCGGGNAPSGPNLISSTTMTEFNLASSVSKSGYWAWISGSDRSAFKGVYGTKGVSAPDNSPSARTGSANWVDKNGILWLFGGEGLAGSSVGFLNDTWKFVPNTGQWTWVSGSNTVSARGTYGQPGVATVENSPSARDSALSLQAANGDLWLFGGRGIETGSGELGSLNDLWRFSVSTGMWTFVSGSKLAGVGNVSSALGAFAPSNSPGSRSRSHGWLDANGNIWVYGGVGQRGQGPNGAGYGLDDLWKFDVTLGYWALMAVSGLNTSYSVHGTLGQSAPGNSPGTRFGGLTWTDPSGDFWLFGGDGYVPTSNGVIATGLLNDLWKFSPTNGQWTWVSGSKTVQALGVYGTKGVAMSSTSPGSRIGSVTWVDTKGRLWLFGGYGKNSVLDATLDDLWVFDPTLKQWAWINGSAQQPSNGSSSVVFGSLGVAEIGNTPGSRGSSIGWVDAQGGLWLFGGNGSIRSGNALMSDLWRYQI